jgi:lipopolysaccharide/colanic/teichoic acid biosynthesis glycosyltransferase
MIRIFDLLFSILGLLLLSPIFCILIILGLFDTGSPFFLQNRLGRNKEVFTLIKFRTMHKDTNSVATHLVSKNAVTPLGMFLRRSKLDEIPQLLNVFLGHMSLVGPRPNLENQAELIGFRDQLAVYQVRPGITGLAQVNEIDMSTPKVLAEMDRKMIDRMSMVVYFQLILKQIIDY